MKIKMGLMALLIAMCTNVHGQFTLRVHNGDDDILSPSPPSALPIIANSIAKSGPLPPLNNIPLGTDGVTLASLVTPGSTNLGQSRVFAMAGLSGITVPTDRMYYPPAWHCIPVMGNNSMYGLQWFDMLVTSNKSWMGTETLTNPATGNENGHRAVYHSGGVGPVGQYEGEVVVTLTNANLNSRFRIGTNTQGAEILFNPNFVGVNYGANGVLNSHYDPALGRWVAGTDDTVYDNGQSPSAVTYHGWHRFGATISVDVDGSNGFLAMRRQFAGALQSITVNLYRNGVLVSSRTVYAAKVKLGIVRNPPAKARISFNGGQWNAPYTLQWRSAFNTNAPWQNYQSNPVYYSGENVDVATTEAMEFFQAVALGQ